MARRFRLDDVRNEEIANSKIIRQYSAKPKSNNYVDGTFKPLLDAFLDCSTCRCDNDCSCNSYSCRCEGDCGSESSYP